MKEMKLTPQQHRNIANGMDRIKKVTNDAYFILNYYPLDISSFYSKRFNKNKIDFEPLIYVKNSLINTSSEPPILKDK